MCCGGRVATLRNSRPKGLPCATPLRGQPTAASGAPAGGAGCPPSPSGRGGSSSGTTRVSATTWLQPDTSGRSGSCFNESATFQSRKRGCARSQSSCRVASMGPGPFIRGHESNLWWLCHDCHVALQWGRDSSVADTLDSTTVKPESSRASMGPRPFSRGHPPTRPWPRAAR